MHHRLHSALATLTVSLASVASMLGSRAAQAAVIPVVNPGFENIIGETPVGEFTFGALTGWNLYEATPGATSDGDGPDYYIGTLTPQFNPSTSQYEYFPAGAAEGQRVGIAYNTAATAGGTEYGLVQTLTGSTLQANTTYTLEVEIGNIASGLSFGFTTPFTLDGFPGYRVDLLAGGVVVASDNNSLAGSIPEGQFATSTVTLTTGINPLQLNQTLGIRLVNLNDVDPGFPGSDLEVDFDNVRLNAVAVPEPVTGLLVVGAIGALARRRRLR